ncbi:MAG: serine protease [Verrucomicrobia bacterium]|nr:MAG: serine protease [Verrucomicrobiota bacterium]
MIIRFFSLGLCLRCPRAASAFIFYTLAQIALTGQAGAQLLPKTEWARSVVQIEVTFKIHDAFQPWNDPTRSVRKHGLVVGERELLTSAQYLPTHTLVRVQKGGRGRWFDARVTWWDAQSNLALLTTEAPDFWAGLQPALLAEDVSRGPDFELVRWREGNLETRRVEFGRFMVGEGVLGLAPHVILEVSTDLTGLGWSEIVARGGRVVGMTAYSTGRTCGVIPAAFIRRVLDAYRKNQYSGLSYLDFTWQPGSNPKLLNELGLPGAPRGVVVQSPGREKDPAFAPQARDVILEIGGFAVDGEGDYLDPDFGHLQIENLPNRAHFAGEVIPIKIQRGDQELTLNYTLPRAAFTDELVPRELFGAPAKYIVAGGLIFQPLAQPFLRGWGEDWRKQAPFYLQYFLHAAAPDKRKSLVVLTGILPDAINLGYENESMLTLDKVNGQTIATLDELANALVKPSDGGVHRFDFLGGRSLQRLLLDAATLEEATQRVVKHYGIPAAMRL